uniref:RING-type domain-containing protein n=2 Tax=Aegilops tauschii subsp. strangulata TaxID=200361 RepID=A0A453RQM3_AEGTS
MEGPKGNGGEKHSADQNHSPNTPAAAGAGGDDVSAAAAAAVGRRPFTALSQEEADLALARVLQEQERAYMMLSAHGGDGSEYDASDAGSYDYYDEEEEGIEGDEGSDYEEEGDEDEEVGEAEGPELDPARYEDDEAYARALQDAEEREVAQRLMALAGITDLGEEMEHDVEDEEDGDSAQDAWEDVDPDEYSYEELVALGEVVGTESRGVSANTLASLPLVTYQAEDNQDSNMEQCVICRVEFEEGESLVALPCKHSYHSDCINQWLQLNKVQPPPVHPLFFLP